MASAYDIFRYFSNLLDIWERVSACGIHVITIIPPCHMVLFLTLFYFSVFLFSDYIIALLSGNYIMNFKTKSGKNQTL